MNPCFLAAAVTAAVKPPIVGYRYKQTSMQFYNNASAAYDGGGYVVTMNNNYSQGGDAQYAKFNADHGDVFAISFTRTRGPSNSSSSISYQSGQNIVTCVFWNDGNILFGGAFYNVGTITNNKVDIAIVLNLTTKTARLLATNVIGGAKTVVAETSFATTTVTSNLIQLYADDGVSQLSNILVYNNDTFTVG